MKFCDEYEGVLILFCVIFSSLPFWLNLKIQLNFQFKKTQSVPTILGNDYYKFKDSRLLQLFQL